MQFSLLDFEMNDTCEDMNFTLTYFIMLHYLVKVETPKIHVNTTSASNVNCRIAVTCIKLHWQFHMEHSGESYKWTCVQSVHHQHTHMISDSHATGQSQHQWCPGQSQTKFAPSVFEGCRCHEALFHTHCCIAPLISKFKAWWPLSTMKAWWPLSTLMKLWHLMQFSLAVSRWNITFSVFWFLQGSIATLIRWDGWKSYRHMWYSFVSLTVTTALKSVDICRSYRIKISWLLFYGPQCIMSTEELVLSDSVLLSVVCAQWHRCTLVWWLCWWYIN